MLTRDAETYERGPPLGKQHYLIAHSAESLSVVAHLDATLNASLNAHASKMLRRTNTGVTPLFFPFFFNSSSFLPSLLFIHLSQVEINNTRFIVLVTHSSCSNLWGSVHFAWPARWASITGQSIYKMISPFSRSLRVRGSCFATQTTRTSPLY